MTLSWLFPPVPTGQYPWLDMYGGWNMHFISNYFMAVGGMKLPLKDWALLNWFWAGEGWSNYWKSRWVMTLDPLCSCCEKSQTMNQIVNDCPLCAFFTRLGTLHNMKIEKLEWIANLDLGLWWAMFFSISFPFIFFS